MRFDLIDRRVCDALNAHDGKNNDGRSLVRVGAAETHDAPLIGEFDDVAHQPLPFDIGAGSSTPIHRCRLPRRLSGMQG
jgi:hypothetical protein